MGVSQYYDAMIKLEREGPQGHADDPTYKPPRGHDKHLSDSERAAIPRAFEAVHKRKHEARHGQDALGKVPGQTTVLQKIDFGRLD